MLQETWLEESVQSIEIAGYTIVSRRDCKETSNRGGILTLRRDDFNCIVHIADSADDDRSWHFIRLGVDTILLANWHRPGSTVHDGFLTLYDEVRGYFHEVSGIVIAGDLNIHHQRWLRFSNANT